MEVDCGIIVFIIAIFSTLWVSVRPQLQKGSPRTSTTESPLTRENSRYFEIEDPVLNDICWLILISLIKRDESSLSHMGFNDKQKKFITKNNLDSHLK